MARHARASLLVVLAAVWIVAPLAVGLGVLAVRLAQPQDAFPLVLGATTAFGLAGGVAVAAIQRRTGRPSPVGDRGGR
ncbi:hypothetical protein [Nucisporomicrobium flavum]|uniref:hypothetical protein n=1 Tax=Nucisporomicrobium flavum TaxID=2785915 RepID=UPI0018F32BC3|nr:hypothetical protein [Nucisporomicrobium flavum]